MDKPTDCGLCPFEDFGYCNVKGERNTSEKGVDADCPLIEIADRKTEPSADNLSAFEDEPQTGEMMTEEEFDSMLARVLTGNNEPQTERSE
jgi:hypothetical protein